MPLRPYNAIVKYSVIYPMKYTHFFCALFIVVIRPVLVNLLDLFTPIVHGYFTGKGAVVRLSQCQWHYLEIG